MQKVSIRMLDDECNLFSIHFVDQFFMRADLRSAPMIRSEKLRNDHPIILSVALLGRTDVTVPTGRIVCR